jgi:iron complex outermembrane receptor protein
MIQFAGFNPKTLSLAVTVASALALPQQALSQKLEEVVVTAQKRAQSLQDVPISISALSGDKLNDAIITRTSDLSSYVPNLTMSEAAIGTNVFIRGVGSQVNQGFEQSVSTYVDGVYYGRPRQLRTPFFDLERIEVLRGPQAILFGKNSIGGALSLISAKPSDQFEGELGVVYEPSHGETIFTAIVSGPLSDTLSGRLSLRKRDIDGYIDNKINNRDEMESDEWFGRGTLRWEPSDSLDITFKAELGEYDNKGRNMVVLGDPVATTPIVNDFQKRAVDGSEFSNNKYDNYTLSLNYQLGESTLTAISGWSSYEFQEEWDGDVGIAPILQVPSSEDFEQFSQELRLVSPGGETIDYIAGVFYQTSELDFSESLVLNLPSGLSVNVPRQYESNSDSWAVFAQATWNASDILRATMGLRYTQEDKDGSRMLRTTNPDGSVFPVDDFAPLGAPLPPLGIFVHDLSAKRSENSFTPSLIIQWDASKSTMLYSSISTGYKAGGFDARSNRGILPDGSPALEFEEEEALSFEAGAKMSLLDGGAELNIALFRTEYEDLQVSVFDGVLGFDVQNAAEATTQGIEIDGRWQVSEHVTLSGSIAHTDFEFQNYPNGACYKGQAAYAIVDGVGVCDWDGNTNQLTPEWSGVGSADFYYPFANSLIFTATVDLIYSDDYFAAPDLDPNVKQDSFWKLNARIGLGDVDDSWDIALVGTNLTDEEIVTFANDVPLTGPSNTYFAIVERPVTVAIQARYRF